MNISAQIVTNISGQVEIVDMPSNLNGGEFISQTHIRLMYEGAGTVTATMPNFPYDGAYHDPSLPIAQGDNTFGNAITTPYSGPGLPEVGAEVYSVFLHFDPNLSGLPFDLGEGIAQSGTITFDRPILGVYVTSGALNTTDDIFTPSGVTFPTTIGRDMEFNYDGDQYLISPDRYELSLTMFCHNGGVLDEMRIILETNPTVDLKTRIFLEGPFTGSSMGTELNPDDLPIADPYSHGETVESNFFASHLDIVDWVLIELRTGETAAIATTVATRAAFVKSDGNIVDLDGTSPVKFNGVTGDYYIVVRHRNHLAVMSVGTVALPNSTAYDFTIGSSQYYGGSTGAKDLGSGMWGMIAGDGNGSGQVQNNDSEDIWKPDNGLSGYKDSDFNMNGQVQNNDNEDYWKPNNGRGSQVP